MSISQQSMSAAFMMPQSLSSALTDLRQSTISTRSTMLRKYHQLSRSTPISHDKRACIELSAAGSKGESAEGGTSSAAQPASGRRSQSWMRVAGRNQRGFAPRKFRTQRKKERRHRSPPLQGWNARPLSWPLQRVWLLAWVPSSPWPWLQTPASPFDR
jgi:hypothetical protein